MSNANASDSLKQYEETARLRNYAKLYPPMPVATCTGEPWRPVMTEQERQQHEQYVRENNLPF